MLSQQVTYTTEADYLQWEARQPVRHEYIGGQIHAMTGATLRHNVIAGNVYASLRPHLRATPCRAFVEAVKTGNFRFTARRPAPKWTWLRSQVTGG